MKLYAALLLALSLVALNAKTQESNEPKTLFGNGLGINTSNVGVFLAPAYGITAMDGYSTSLINLRGGLIIDDKLSFGGFFSSSLNEIRPTSETVQNVYMDYWAIGGVAEYAVMTHKMIHLTFPIYFGYGEVQMDNETGDAGLGESNFFQIEPSALLEVNLNKYVRFNIGGGYRFITPMTYRNFNESHISGLTGYIGLKIGLFR